MYGPNERTFTVGVTNLDLDLAVVALTGTCTPALSDGAETEPAATLQELHQYLRNAQICPGTWPPALELTVSDIDALDFALREVTHDVAVLRYQLSKVTSQQSS